MVLTGTFLRENQKSFKHHIEALLSGTIDESKSYIAFQTSEYLLLGKV